jgi:predicted membrane-bound mannosyltransferase
MLPLTLMAGYGLGQCYERLSLRVVAPLVAGVAVVFSLYQAIDISFFHYDDDTYAYVYAHTRRDFLSLVREIETIAASNPAGKDIGITVLSPEHWPLPWYLRDYTHVGYWGHVVPTSEPMVIALEPQTVDVEQVLGNKYRRYSSHDLRPGNLLVLYVRKDIQP